MKGLVDYILEGRRLSQREVDEYFQDAVIWLRSHEILSEREAERFHADSGHGNVALSQIKKVEDALEEYNEERGSGLDYHWWEEYDIPIEDFIIQAFG